MELNTPPSTFMKTKVWLDDATFSKLDVKCEEDRAAAIAEICLIAQNGGLSVSNTLQDPLCIEGSLSDINALQKVMEKVVYKLQMQKHRTFIDMFQETLVPLQRNENNRK